MPHRRNRSPLGPPLLLWLSIIHTFIFSHYLGPCFSWPWMLILSHWLSLSFFTAHFRSLELFALKYLPPFYLYKSCPHFLVPGPLVVIVMPLPDGFSLVSIYVRAYLTWANTSWYLLFVSTKLELYTKSIIFLCNTGCVSCCLRFCSITSFKNPSS